MSISSKFDNLFSKMYFEPTINSFKNALLINYKKVGTRWMGMVSSLPEDFNKDKVQFDLFFNTQPIGNPEHSDFYNRIITENKLKIDMGDTYIHTFFDIMELDRILGEPPNLDESGFVKFNSNASFFKHEGVNSWNELLFENPHKDIVFLIRNPLERYVTGCVQILFMLIDEIPNNEQIRNELKFYVDLDDSELRNLYKFLRSNNFVQNMDFESLNYTAISKILKYIVDKRTDLVFQDIHTQNYLKNYIELIHHIKDKSKIKIIDISQCSTNKAIKFFDKLRGDDELSKMGDKLHIFKESNKPIYQFFINEYVYDNHFERSSLRFYIESEYNTYLQLLNSEYFVNLQD